jgi:uncharacterized MAPEG superfamily protein
MTEIELLAIVTVMTALMWIPYVLERIVQQGLLATVGYPDRPPTVAAWAERARKAHSNAVENLVIFGVLSVTVQISGAGSDLTLLASQIYVTARIAHYLCYLFAIPWLRTGAFFAGFGAQVMLAVTIL